MMNLVQLHLLIEGKTMKQIAACLTEHQLSEVSDACCDAALCLGELSYYLGYRGAYGCGDHGHDKAVEQACRHRPKLRKALGYSYPTIRRSHETYIPG